MVYYKLVIVIIDILGLTNVIINVTVRYHGLPTLIITNQGLLLPQISGYYYVIS